MENFAFTVFILCLLFIVTLFLFGMIFYARTPRQAFWYGFTIISLLGVTLSTFWNQADFVVRTGGKMRLVLISVDGLSPRNLPLMPRLMRSFSRSFPVRGVTPTLTYPAHTTLLTGQPPSVHGIRNNTVFDPKTNDPHAWQWFYHDIRAPTLFDACFREGKSTMNIQWPVTAGAYNITYSLPVIWRSGTVEDVKLIESLMRPKVNLLEMIKNANVKGTDDLSGIIGDRIRSMIAQNWMWTYEPYFSAVYFGALDHVNHKFGSQSIESQRTLSQLDALLSDLVRFIHEAEPSCVVAIVSDHGFSEVLPNGTVNLYSDLHLSKEDVYIFSADGSAAFYILQPQNITRSVLFKRIQALPYVEEARIGGDEDGTFQDADVFLSLKLGYVNLPQHAAEEQKGAHGYSPKHREMDAVFLLSNNAPPTTFPPGACIPMTSICPYLLHSVLFHS